MRFMNGICLVDKKAGSTSFDVISLMRRKTHISRIGHTGTLDPMASGLLCVLVGNATKLTPYLRCLEKEYIASYAFGYESDTQDIWGNLSPRPFQAPKRERVESAMQEFTGEILQVPPMYSAVKVRGKKLYEYAREGKQVERTPRKVHVYQYELLELDEKGMRVRLVVSSGTYVRTLAHDLGEKIQVPTVMSSLQRTRIGPFSIRDAVPADEIPDRPEKLALIDPYDALRFYPYVEAADEAAVLQGKRMRLNCADPLVMVTHQGRILAAYRRNGDGSYSCERGLL